MELTRYHERDHLRRMGDHWKLRRDKLSRPQYVAGSGAIFHSQARPVDHHITLRMLNAMSPEFFRKVPGFKRMYFSSMSEMKFGWSNPDNGFVTLSRRKWKPEELAHFVVHETSHFLTDSRDQLLYKPERQGELVNAFRTISGAETYMPTVKPDGLDYAPKITEDFGHFLTESSANYVVRGTKFKRFIAGINDPKVRNAYETVYGYLKDVHGREYKTKWLMKRVPFLEDARTTSEIGRDMTLDAVAGKRVPIPKRVLYTEYLSDFMRDGEMKGMTLKEMEAEVRKREAGKEWA